MGWFKYPLKYETGKKNPREGDAFLQTRGDLSGTTVVLPSGESVYIPRELLFKLVAMYVRDARQRQFDREQERSDEEILGIAEKATT